MGAGKGGRARRVGKEGGRGGRARGRRAFPPCKRCVYAACTLHTHTAFTLHGTLLRARWQMLAGQAQRLIRRPGGCPKCLPSHPSRLRARTPTTREAQDAHELLVVAREGRTRRTSCANIRSAPHAAAACPVAHLDSVSRSESCHGTQGPGEGPHVHGLREGCHRPPRFASPRVPVQYRDD